MPEAPLRCAAGWALCAAAIALAGCASGPKGGSSGGRDGPGANPPSGLNQTPDAEPRIEPVRSSGGTSKPYTVLGRSYVPITDDRAVRESGLASWYGRKFHSQSTASGEPYDMYAMTAAHKTLPLPSYVRVRNPANGREVIVRVNDRGPFHDDRVIDLSYTAALRLDLLRGVAPVEIERITNDDIRAGTWRRGGGDTMLAAAPLPAPVAVPMPSVEVPSALTTRTAGQTASAFTTPASPQPRIMVAELPPMMNEPAPPAPPPPVSSKQDDPWADAALVNPASAAQPTPSAFQAPEPVAGYWVQLGAFRERDGAEGLRVKAASGMPALSSQLRVFSEGGTNRLQVGPFMSRDAALGAVSQVRDTLGIAPMVVERR
ncbi:septal ring lytic transglycosylase RlpA family protein [Variovorax sp. RHLX14]|uniref:septal ring lytic transglycosylase RlpA family protein n=1 Tax=Variovorax sp. RHLX14 TaxID=1259731 RepID=UPI003F46EDBF